MKRKLVVAFSLILLVTLSLTGYYFYSSQIDHLRLHTTTSSKRQESNVDIPPATDNSQYEIEVFNKPEYFSEVSIISTGDILFHMPEVNAAAENGSYDFRPMFSEVKDLISSKDIAVADFETTVNPKLKYSGYPSFNTPIQALDAVKDTGFQVLLAAHNHSLDTGLEGLRSTISLMKSHGFKVLGAGEPEEDKSVIIEKNNIKVGMLAYTYGTNYGVQHTDMINYINETKIKNDMNKIRSKCDFVIVYLHLGTEYVRTVEAFQSDLIKKVAAMGADAILCSHPHVARKTEMLEINGRKVLVNYSMGNFISNQNDKYTDMGSMESLVIQKKGDVTYLKSAETIPVYRLRYSDKNKKIFKTVPYYSVDKFDGVLNSSTLSYISTVTSELAFKYITEDIPPERTRQTICIIK